MKVIITRPVEDALPLANNLKSVGHEVVIIPVLKIIAREGVVFPNRTYQAICLTSANGVRVLNNIAAIKSVPVFAVGPQSMRVAFERGFTNVKAIGGDVAGLAAHIAIALRPSEGPILYISGSTTSGDLEGKLRRNGFDVDRVITYDAQPTTLLGYEQEIQTSQAVLLYSPRSAKLWSSAISNLQLQNTAFSLIHVCLSAAIASCLPDNWPKRVAKQLTEASLIAELDC